jgi:hypothetical protein
MTRDQQAAAMRHKLCTRILDHAWANWRNPKWKQVAYGLLYGATLPTVARMLKVGKDPSTITGHRANLVLIDDYPPLSDRQLPAT